MNEDQVLDIFDSLVILPRRDTLKAIVAKGHPVTAVEIAASLRISVSEVLDHLEALERSGLIASAKGVNGTEGITLYSVHPLSLSVSVSWDGILFEEVKPKLGLWQRLRKALRIS